MRPTKQADYEDWQETDAGRRTWLKLQRTNSARSTMSHRTPSILCKIARFKQNLKIFARIDIEGPPSLQVSNTDQLSRYRALIMVHGMSTSSLFQVL